MNDYRNFKEEMKSRWEERMERRGNSHVWTGLFLLIIGGVALAKSFGVPMPVWLFSWQMLLIAIGLLIGAKRGFRDGGWFVPIIVGGAFLLNDYFLYGDLRRHMWPLILIVIGLFFIIRPKRRRGWHHWEEKKNAGAMTGAEATIPSSKDEEFSQNDFINSTCIFSGAKRVVLSKNFKGGDLVNVFGGCEIDLTQADMTSPAVLDVSAIFGGATLVVPSNWSIKSEAVTIFGGISDKRRFPASPDANPKTLIVKGALIFGGMEIKSY
jgi:predicted membrane protein